MRDDLKDELVRLVADLDWLIAHRPLADQRLPAARTRMRVTRQSMAVSPSRAALESAVADRLASPDFVPLAGLA